MFRAVAVLAVLILLVEAPPGSDPESPKAKWYHSLQQPNTGISCCSVSDCRTTSARQTPDGHWQALHGDEWVDVPDDKVLKREDNMEGLPILCYHPGNGVMCFLRPSEA